MIETAKITKDSIEFHVKGLRGLSQSATKFLRQHPNEAQMAIAVALETAATQYKVQSNASDTDVPENLKPFIVHQPISSDRIGVSEAAERLKISRTTVYDWVEKKILLAWKPTKRGLIIPAEQIIGPGKIVPGIAQVLGIVDDPELAWEFLSEKWPFADKATRPINKLKSGDIDDVVNAAPSFGTAFT